MKVKTIDDVLFRWVDAALREEAAKDDLDWDGLAVQVEFTPVTARVHYFFWYPVANGEHIITWHHSDERIVLNKQHVQNGAREALVAIRQQREENEAGAVE